MSDVLRPWQGAVLAVLCYAMAAYILWVMLVILVGSLGLGALGEMTTALSGTEEMGGMMAGIFGVFGMGLLLIQAPFAYLFYAMGRGFWRGKFWPVVLTMILAVSLFLLSLAAMDPVIITVMLVSLVFNVMVWRHPYYHQAR